jgi:hypothetical protein
MNIHGHTAPEMNSCLASIYIDEAQRVGVASRGGYHSPKNYF